jgi:hypothetical protein
MARADFAIADIEGGTMVGETSPNVYGASANVGYRSAFGPGTVGRKEAYITLGVAAMLFVYWRASKGY